MSKRKKLLAANEEIFSTKQFFIKYAKRYGIVLLISVPIIMFFSYFMSKTVDWYSGAVSFFGSLVLLLLACLIGLVIFTKLDDKKKEKTTKEDERDPFAD